MWNSRWRFDINLFASGIARFFLTLGRMETVLSKHSWLLLLMIICYLDLIRLFLLLRTYLIGLFLFDFLWFVNYWLLRFIFWSLLSLRFMLKNGKISYTLIILLLDSLHKLPLTAIFGFICLLFHYFVNFDLFLLFSRICKLLHINLYGSRVVIFLFDHACNILRSELSILIFGRGWKSNFWLKWRRQPKVLVWTSIKSTAVFLKVSVMSIVISLIFKMLGTWWRGKFWHDLCVEIGRTIVFN